MNVNKKTICDLFLERVNITPKNNAIGEIIKGKIHYYDFQTYKSNIESLSLALFDIGLEAQDKAAILSHTEIKWNLTDLSIMCARGITIPIYPTYTAQEALYILNHSESKIVFVQDLEQFKKIIEIQDQLEFVKKVICFQDVEISIRENLKDSIDFYTYDQLIELGIKAIEANPDFFNNSISKISENDLATIVYTSGTTGEPKGAMIKHKALYQVLINVKKYTHNALYESDRILTFLPLSHVLGRCESFFPIIFGCEAVYAESMNKLIDNIPVVRPTIMLAVPRVFEKIFEKVNASLAESEIKSSLMKWAQASANKYFEKIDNDRSPSTFEMLQYQSAKKLVLSKIYERFGGSIRYFISGGAPLSPKIISFFRNVNLTILEGYGLTETIAPCCVNPMSKQVLGTVGKPIGDVEISFKEDGEILIRSEALFSGYYKNEEETQKVLDKDGWFSSGDIGEFTKEGFLKITDRKKDIIITSGGKNVAPQKIENMLKLSPFISQVVIVGDQKKYLTALVGIEKEAYLTKLSELNLEESISFNELVNHSLINQIVKDEIEKVNDELASFESIKNFQILPIELTVENYLTPSLKVKKKLVLKDYENLINAMYK